MVGSHVGRNFERVVESNVLLRYYDRGNCYSLITMIHACRLCVCARICNMCGICCEWIGKSEFVGRAWYQVKRLRAFWLDSTENQTLNSCQSHSDTVVQKIASS